MIIKFNLNGVDKEVIVSPSEYLLDTLCSLSIIVALLTIRFLNIVLLW